MGGFATNGVNMTKLESYMIEGNFFATQFYADVEGHPEDRSLVFAFEELAFFSKEMKILGVYRASFRATSSGRERLATRAAYAALFSSDGAGWRSMPRGRRAATSRGMARAATRRIRR
jgi:hypothetical protein